MENTTGVNNQQLPYNSWFDWTFSPPNATRLASILSGLTGIYEGYQLTQADSGKEIVELGIYCLMSFGFGAYLWRYAHHEEQKILQNRAFIASILSEEDRKNL